MTTKKNVLMELFKKANRVKLNGLIQITYIFIFMKMIKNRWKIKKKIKIIKKKIISNI